MKSLLPIVALLVAATSHAQTVNTSVRGTLFDSLNMTPLAGAVVWISGTSRTAVADSKGEFTLVDVPVGEQLIAFSSPWLDSLGLGTLGTRARIQSGVQNTFQLSTPSFHGIWNAMCRDRKPLGPDSGIVWGTVRDAATGMRLSGARTSIEWYDFQLRDTKKIEQSVESRAVRTDSTATYYACGLPTDIALHTHADGTHSSSGNIQFTIGARRLQRVDLLVSAEMDVTALTRKSKAALNAKADASVSASIPHGTATVRGIVSDEHGKAIASAVLAFALLDTMVRSNDSGQFALSGLPGGTHDLEFQSIGFVPERVAVALRPGMTTEVNTVLVSSQTLAAIDVRATAISADRRDYNMRRKAGFGYGFDAKDFTGKSDAGSVLQAVPSSSVNRVRGEIGFTLKRGASVCTPLIWLDGRRDPTALQLPLDKIRAIEVFSHIGSAPAQYANACGAVLVWSTSSRW